jgi:hypothetical protein
LPFLLGHFVRPESQAKFIDGVRLFGQTSVRIHLVVLQDLYIFIVFIVVAKERERIYCVSKTLFLGKKKRTKDGSETRRSLKTLSSSSPHAE